MPALAVCLLHENVDHVQFRIDSHIGTGGTVPFQLSKRTWRRRLRKPRIGADSEAVTKAESIAGKIKIIPRDARSRSDMVGGHLPERRLAEISPVIEFSPLEQHLGKSCVIGDGREQARAARFPTGIC